MDLDSKGIPIIKPDVMYASKCPPNPCELCTGNGKVYRNGVLVTSWYWCQVMDSCAATVDWARISGR